MKKLKPCRLTLSTITNHRAFMLEKTNSSQALDPVISARIRDCCQLGYQYYDNGEIKTAIRQFYTAWNLLPKPQTQWREAGWVLTALGDAYVKTGNFNSARESLTSALHCPDTQHNPVILFQLGCCQFELGNYHEAVLLFRQTIDCGGEKMFDKADKKYWAAVKQASPV